MAPSTWSALVFLGLNVFFANEVCSHLFFTEFHRLFRGLTEFCRIFQLFGRVEVCNLSNNRLFWVPSDVDAAPHLTRLHLSFNRLCVLPRSLERLQSLVCLDLYENLLEQIDCDLSRIATYVLPSHPL